MNRKFCHEKKNMTKLMRKQESNTPVGNFVQKPIKLLTRKSFMFGFKSPGNLVFFLLISLSPNDLP